MIIQKELFLPMFKLNENITGSKYINKLESQIVCSLAKYIKSETIIEFGVQDGYTALNLFNIVPTIKRYIGIDLPKDGSILLESEKEQKPIDPAILVNAKIGFELKEVDSNLLTKEDLPMADFIFIDGGHDFATVKHDSELSLSIINDGGVIIWHDYNTVPGIGVRDYINGLCQQQEHGGDRNILIEGTWLVYRFC